MNIIIKIIRFPLFVFFLIVWSAFFGKNGYNAAMEFWRDGV